MKAAIPVKDQEPHFLFCYRTESHHVHVGTHGNLPILSSLTHMPFLC